MSAVVMDIEAGYNLNTGTVICIRCDSSYTEVYLGFNYNISTCCFVVKWIVFIIMIVPVYPRGYFIDYDSASHIQSIRMSFSPVNTVVYIFRIYNPSVI